MAARTRSRYDDVEAQPKSDAYTGLLALSFIAMVASCVILFMDYAQYGDKKSPPVPNLGKITGGPVNQGAPVGGGAAPADLPPLAALPIIAAPTEGATEPITTVAGVADGPMLPAPPQ